jgi:hypothetical protein
MATARLWVTYVRMATWWLCAGGRVGPVVHMCAGKARRVVAFAVHMWATGLVLVVVFGRGLWCVRGGV